MSYDLYFMVPGSRERISREAFHDYFSSRPRYRIEGDTALYGNDATGCHFWFTWQGSEEADEDIDDVDENAPDDDLKPAGVAFEINYYRPFWFPREAEPELSSFVTEFDVHVDDPQFEGMGRGMFEPSGFHRGWAAGNRTAIMAMNRMGGPDAPAALADDDVVLDAWKWNFNIEALQARLGDDAYVPRILMVSIAGKVQTCCSWAWNTPTAIPKVEGVILGRPARGILGRLKGPEFALADYGDIPGLGVGSISDGGEFRMSPAGDSDLWAWFQQARSIQPKLIPTFEVFERDAYENAASQSGRLTSTSDLLSANDKARHE